MGNSHQYLFGSKQQLPALANSPAAFDLAISFLLPPNRGLNTERLGRSRADSGLTTSVRALTISYEQFIETMNKIEYSSYMRNNEQL